MKEQSLQALFLYAVGFFLVWEWLRPIEQLTETGHIGIFLVFLIVALAVYFLRLKGYVVFLINGLYILASIHYLHYKGVLLRGSWVLAFFHDFKKNIGWLVAGDWDQLSNEFRTFLFFVLLWIMVYLIHYWMIKRRQIFLFFMMTLIYVTVLDTFTPYKANGAIVRIVLAGFTAMGVLKFYRILADEKLGNPSGSFRKWIVPFAGLLSVSIAVGFAAPKADPVWPDPVPFLKAAKDGALKNQTSGKVGYRQNDSRLGGPFTGDDSPVFRVEAPGKSYWRIETRDTYTGKGWVSSQTNRIAAIPFVKKKPVPNEMIPSTVQKTEASANLLLYKNYPFLLYPAGIKTISTAQQVTFRIDIDRNKITALNGQFKETPIDRYSISYEIPRYKISDLTKAQLEAGADPRISDSFLRRFTQIPAELPSRVRTLAEKITAGKNNWFDKAQALQAYLTGPDFTYDQQNVAVPGEQVDYVDQFLFDTKRGYCDNFSTSMTVMLRSLGIPARWVKGFNGGEFVDYSKKGSNEQIYEITNNNAHSWVEAYFPNQGWVPFEPTKGFDNGIEFSSGTENATAGKKAANTPIPAKEKPKKPESQKDLSNSGNKSSNANQMWQKMKLLWKDHKTAITFLTLLLLIAVILLYRMRRKWIPLFLLLRFRFLKKNESIGPAYLALLKQLHRYGLKRKKSETLRSYAAYVDSFFSTRDMAKLTAIYEQYVYHQSMPNESWQSSRKLWENLIKKTIA